MAFDGLDRISCFVDREVIEDTVRRVIDEAHCRHMLACAARNEVRTGDAMVVVV